MRIKTIIQEKQNNDIVELICVVKNFEVKQRKKVFIDVDVTDGIDSIICRLFNSENTTPFKPNNIIKIRGKVNDYQGSRCIKIDSVEVCNNISIDNFINYNKDVYLEIYNKLANFIENNIKDNELKQVSKYIIESNKDILLKSVAAKLHHHAEPGGLLQHTKEVFLICIYLVKAIEKIYGYKINTDLLYCGAILHDIGKIKAYITGPISGDLTTEGRLLDHITLSVSIINTCYDKLNIEKGNTYLNLLHIIVSHHGQKDWGSMVEPKTIEAYLVHKADDMSSKLNGIFKALKQDVNSDGWLNLNGNLYGLYKSK